MTDARPSGRLVLVATPIGNLGDISARAADVLRSADVIACEDTRHTRKLLNHLDIRDVPVIAAHEHNELVAAAAIATRVASGELVALVSDAGTPAISDPGQRVVAAVVEAGLQVSVVPGPSAFVGALAISGLSTDRFTFEGFLPRKGKERAQRLRAIAASDCTSVIYESPHRLAKSADDLVAACGGDRRVVLVRELTKLYEQVWRGTAQEFASYLGDREMKGECVVLIAGTEAHTEVTDEQLLQALQAARDSGMSRRDAVGDVADRFGLAKGRVYDLAHAEHR